MGRDRRFGGLLRLGAAGTVAAGLLVAIHPFTPLSAQVGAAPTFTVQKVSSDAEVTWTNVDLLTTPVSAGVADGGASQCFGNGAGGNGCFDHISTIVQRSGAAAGFTANYNNGTNTLGLVVIDHHAYTKADPHTTSLCVGDAVPGQTTPTVTITKNANATICNTVVSGEQVVANGQVAIEGQGQDGKKGAFWWSVEENSQVQRTLAGVTSSGGLIIAEVTARSSGDRNGMTLEEAAKWLISHGVVAAIALDGGEQAEAYVNGRGSLVPLQNGQPWVQVSLLLDPTVPILPPAPSPSPGASPVPIANAPDAAQGHSGGTPTGSGSSGHHTTSPAKLPLPSTGVAGTVVMQELPQSGAVPLSGALPASGLGPDGTSAGADAVPAVPPPAVPPPSVATTDDPATSAQSTTGLLAW